MSHNFFSGFHLPFADFALSLAALSANPIRTDRRSSAEKFRLASFYAVLSTISSTVLILVPLSSSWR